MRDARIGEIYEDRNGRRWLVAVRYTEPTIGLQEIRSAFGGEARPIELFGGVTGIMWDGFTKLCDASDERQDVTTTGGA